MRVIALAIPLLVAACFGMVGPRVARLLPPRHATWLLSAGAAVAALSGLAILSFLGFVLIGQLPEIANQGHWSASALRENAPVDQAVGMAALLALVAAVAAFSVVAGRRGLAVRTAYRSCRELSGVPGDLVVVPEPSVGAVAIPGRPGRIVVARALLATLSATERRALLAHERAHLDHCHHWHRAAVSLAVSANPLLAPLRGAALQATERWADEEAAAEIGDRRQVAAALTRAALSVPRRPRGLGAEMTGATHAVPQRVIALLGRPPEPRPLLICTTAALLLGGVIAAVVAGKETEHLFEFAGRAYQATHGS